MAIAGLHNVSVLENSFLRESQSQASRRRENGSTRASSLLQMWRELEDEHVVSHAQERVSERMLQQRGDDLSMTDLSDRNSDLHSGVSEDMSVSENDFGQWSPDRFGSQSGNEDSSNFNCEHLSDLGEVERERVRQIFREWMNSGGRERTSNGSHRNNSSRAQWLGETEQERVRIIREWVQMNSQQRGACIDSREEQASDVGGQIARVLDGLVVNQNEGRTEHVRRGIRKLCGRQALLDMLKKAERERQTELQGLLEHRAVSNFAHRNRIQSLLRGRFLRNDRMVEDDRSISIAASELGLLRQKQTVSGLREGFFSRLENSGCGPASSNRSDTSSYADTNGDRNVQNKVYNSDEVIDGLNDQSEHDNEETYNQRFLDGRTDLEADVVEDISWQETSACVEEWHEQVSETVVREWQWLASVESNESRDVIGQVLDGDWQDNLANELPLKTSQNEAGEHSNLEEVVEASYEHSPQAGERSGTHGLMNVLENLERNPVQYIDGQESASQVEQWQEEYQENVDADWQEASVEYNELMDGGNEEASDMHHEDGGNEDVGYDHLQEALDMQHEDGSLHEATQNWLQGSHSQEPVAVGRTDTFFPDDDNVHSMELRELLSRRSVSTLLNSGFRESLNQLLQSYVERQNHATIDWELNETSAAPASLEHDIEEQRRDQNEGQGDAESPLIGLPSPRMPPMQPLWDQDSHHYNWAPDDVHQRFGIEWEIISDLRIDMARLQQRMNNMQRMLEACMDMQLELQRSIRQEVSAALNRTAGSQGMIDDNLPKDASNWDNVRKGICCICSEGNIDSLLYRCGHMCTCSKCANELVQGGGKCPMCRAPVIEVIRAYSIL
ncbi:uncharacterized protein LOC111284599 [Durio zibethinus]|uniref:Uncharacterized protein LOC111284599 n=1 Tax=Durio zibethinus TaxID=66656 RepID=A0A6P5XLJ6_DURZI|nr:uncharacterized protein LOC111284599 [Durio zibethinus]XP_022729078.1 uncharacterized protein LOC111284599 [Durio zibethinus]XP_022729079.1 uncharacterized protein LOC111284599 [Durio zibethinus]XP_022729080.1 uncharacterized protein LOC111284599 [Durio zibethinus]XP_022729081.1 uncharacterized protein LOC111284599 [Durio zibethinus]